MDGDGRHGDDDWVLPCAALADVTLALVGKIAFPSDLSYSWVTLTCQKRSRTLHDGCATRTLNVIDTPGLFEVDTTLENVHTEVARCLDMTKDGIRVILMVFSATCRFSREDEKIVESIKLLLGDKVLDHMILVFTHGDLVGEEIILLQKGLLVAHLWKKKLSDSAPAYLQDMLNLCKNRVVLFNNKTSNKKHHLAQLKKLLDAVDSVISSNDGYPFSNQISRIQQPQSGEELSVDVCSAEQMSRMKKEIHDDCLAQLAQMVEENLNSTITRLEKLLLGEQKARLESENEVAEALLRSEKEIKKLSEMLEKARQESENGQKEMEKLKKRVKTLEKKN
ncbi:hypothetical protein VPH35_029491 [Triticum aestivum]